MTQFLAVALVCALSIAGPDCTRDNALDVAAQAVPAGTDCNHFAELMAVQAFGPIQPGTYRKTICTRRRMASAEGEPRP